MSISRLGPKNISPVPDSFEGNNLRSVKLINESSEKISSSQTFWLPKFIFHPFTFNKLLVSISLNIMALGSPRTVSIASGYPIFPGASIISAV